MMRNIERAGLIRRPKMFQNMRSTRQTELEDRFPGHVVCAWMGNSEAVARKHYLQVTDAHFDRSVSENGAYTVQSRAELGGMGGNRRSKKPEKPLVLQGSSGLPVGDEGLEPPTLSV